MPLKNRRTGAGLRRGDLLHKYRIEKRLGRGGYADVYRAYDTIEGLRVALKIFNSESHVSEKTFRNEARIVSRLDHPNICRLKTAEVIDGQFVLISELGERTLFDVFERSRPASYSIRILEQVLEGLAYAHSQGVIHRDIKPENVLAFPGGVFKIMDFGVSKLVENPMTHTTVTGTPSYRSPEQAYGRPTFASDVFGVSQMFYEMITRHLPRWPFRWPFERHEVFERRVPLKLSHVLRRASNFDLEKRYRDAGAMLRALHAAVPELQNGNRVMTSSTRKISWQTYRKLQFEKRFEKRLALDYRCNKCSGPISEFMKSCPWCGYGRNSFAKITTFPSVCVRCERGVHDDWQYCAWCYGAGFNDVSPIPSVDPRYTCRCSRCGESRLMPHMSYCPWCNSRVRAWKSRTLEHRCPSCRASVAGNFWDHCAWCGKSLTMSLAKTAGGRRTT